MSKTQKKFNNPIIQQARREYGALSKNPNEIHYYGQDEHVTYVLNPETNVVTSKYDFYHTDYKGKRHNEIVFAQNEMSADEFRQAHEILKEVSHEEALDREKEQRELGLTSFGIVKQGQDGAGDTADKFTVALGDISAAKENDALDKSPFQTTFAGEFVLENAGLTDAQRERWERSEYEGLTMREIAEDEGTSIKAISKSVNQARDKIGKAVEDYTAEVNGRATDFEAQRRYASREACYGCKHYNKDLETCMNPNAEGTYDPETEMWKSPHIWDAIEDTNAHVIKTENNGGFGYTTPSCHELDIENDDLMNDLMGVTASARSIYIKPPKRAIYKSDERAENREMVKESNTANKELGALWDSWKRDLVAQGIQTDYPKQALKELDLLEKVGHGNGWYTWEDVEKWERQSKVRQEFGEEFTEEDEDPTSKYNPFTR
jgi:DNA-directed RNA polymerase specialized sigma24 family protein